MGAVHKPAAAQFDRGRVNRLNSEFLEADGSPDDVDDRIEGPHLVEMYFFNRRVMDFRLRFRHFHEDLAGIFFHAIGE